MEKARTTIYLDKEVHDFCKDNKINISEYLNNKIREDFLDINSKVRELEQIKNREEELKEEIQQMRERAASLTNELTTREKRFIYSIPEKLKQGYEFKAMFRLFNNENNRNYTYDEFVQLYRAHEKVARERLAEVSKKNNKKKWGSG